MTRFELISELREKTGITQREADTAVRLIFDEMAEALAKGDRVEIRGFCSFRIKKYRGYLGRQPKTGEPIKVKPKKLPFFKCGSDLKQRTNGSDRDIDTLP